MLPYDGLGYGCSMSWDYAAKNAALEKNEICKCWELSEKHFEIRLETTMHKNVLVKVVCKAEGCSQEFEQSTQLLTKKFLEFYQI